MINDHALLEIKLPLYSGEKLDPEDIKEVIQDCGGNLEEGLLSYARMFLIIIIIQIHY